jgi:hypothetical protein
MTDHLEVVVSRLWNNPEIHVMVTEEGIDIGMDAEYLVQALAYEIARPTILLTKGQRERVIREACNKVFAGMKEASTPVMSRIQKV